MHIKTIELNNFRVYKGTNRIDLAPPTFGETGRNVSIVGGKNGSGKTTFLTSLIWCLYGKNMGKVSQFYKKLISTCGGYEKYIDDDILNKLAKRKGETTLGVSITFSNVCNIPGVISNELKITRTYDTATYNEEITILLDGWEDQQIDNLVEGDPQDKREIFIRDYILPIEMAKFFLFDVERIDSLIETSDPKQRQVLSKNYSEVLGIKKYEDLKEYLDDIADEYRKESAKPEDKTKLITIEAEINKADIKIEDIEKKIIRLEKERYKKQNESDEIQEKLYIAGNKTSPEKLTELKSEEKEIKKRQSDLMSALKELYELIPFGIAGRIMVDLKKQLGNEKSHKKNTENEEQVEGKIEAIINDLEQEKKNFPEIVSVKIRDFYEEKIRILIKKHFSGEDIDTLPEIQILHGLSSLQSKEFDTLISEVQHTLKSGFKNFYNGHGDTRHRLRKINMQIKEAEKNAEDEHYSELKYKKKLLDDRIMGVAKEIGAMDNEKSRIVADRTVKKREQAALRKALDALRPQENMGQKIGELVGRIEYFIESFKLAKSKSLGDRILAEIDRLFHKKDFVHKIDVDIDNFGRDIDIKLFNKQNEEIKKNSFSEGERQLYVSALLKALMEESDIEFPVFIDSPLHKFDPEHRKNIITKYYSHVSNQIVIIPMIHTELAAHDYDLLRDRVNVAYLINNINDYSSTFIPVDDPSQLIEEYERLQHAV